MTLTMIDSVASIRMPMQSTTPVETVDFDQQLTESTYQSDEVHFDDTEVVGDIEGVPLSLIKLYASLALRHAQTEEMYPGEWVSTVVGLKGAYGEGATAAAAEIDLCETIIGWVVVKRRLGAMDIPPMEGIDLNPVDRSPDGAVTPSNEAA
jgi:hypothetical protein